MLHFWGLFYLVARLVGVMNKPIIGWFTIQPVFSGMGLVEMLIDSCSLIYYVCMCFFDGFYHGVLHVLIMWFSHFPGRSEGPVARLCVSNPGTPDLLTVTRNLAGCIVDFPGSAWDETWKMKVSTACNSRRRSRFFSESWRPSEITPEDLKSGW